MRSRIKYQYNGIVNFRTDVSIEIKTGPNKGRISQWKIARPYGMVEDIPLKVRNFTLKKKIVVQIAHLFKEILAIELYHLSESLF